MCHTAHQLSCLLFLPQFVKLLIGQVEKLVKILQTKEKLLEGSRKDLKQLQWVCAIRKKRECVGACSKQPWLGPTYVHTVIGSYFLFKELFLSGVSCIYSLHINCIQYKLPSCELHPAVLLSLPTWQSFSTRKIALQCINSCKLTLTFIHAYVCTVHIQHSLKTIFNPFTYSLNPPLTYCVSPHNETVYLRIPGAYCTIPQSYSGYNTILLLSHCFSFSCVHTL